MSDGESFAIDWGNSSKNANANSYGIDSVYVVGNFSNNASAGSILTLADEYGYAYDYVCSKVFNVSLTDGHYVLSDGSDVLDQTGWNLCLISGGKATFWNIQ